VPYEPGDALPDVTAAPDGLSAARPPVWRHVRRTALLGVTAVSLYLVAPSLLTVLDAWPRLGDVRPWWFAVVLLLQAASFASLWSLLRIALRDSTWPEVARSQLASNAASRIIPGGAATGSVVQATMLVRSGHRPAEVGGALGATGLLTTGMLMTLPVLAVPAVLTGESLPRQLEIGLVASLVVAVVLVGVGLAVLTWDRVVHVVARAVGTVVAMVRRSASAPLVAARVVAERDRVAAAFAGRWLRALAAAAGNRMFDYATLVAALLAVGADVRPSLVLVAYVAAVALGLVPVTPGGLGFVETGLAGLLVVAGAPTDQALAGTLLYRLASYWLPIPVGALAWAGWRTRPRRG
jgi:uncharacterized protein (TIRG00374 family)